MVERVRRLAQVEVLTGHIVTALHPGAGGDLAIVTVRDMTGGQLTELTAQGLFVAIGHSPRTGLADGVLPLTATDHIHTTGPGGATDLPGVFVAGDVADDRFRQAVTAAGAGRAAALETARYLESTHVPGENACLSTPPDH